MPVYCPSCEAGVDANAKFCLQCGHDLETDGPITSTGHDVRQLKELIRGREDLSMAEKFDLIAKVEEGENPIQLGLAAPAEGSGVTPAQMEMQAAAPVVAKGSLSEAAQNYTTSPAAAAAVALMSSQTDAWGLIQSGSINTRDTLFIEAMALGMEASHHIHDIAAGGIDDGAQVFVLLSHAESLWAKVMGIELKSRIKVMLDPFADAQTAGRENEGLCLPTPHVDDKAVFQGGIYNN